MTTNKRTLLLVLAILQCSFFSHLSSAGKFNSIISIGDPLPPFTHLPSVNGNTLSSDDIHEDFLVLVSLSDICPFSNGIEKDLIKLTKTLKKQSAKVIAVNYNMNKGDSLAAMQKRAKQLNYNFVYLKDSEQSLGRQLGTTVTPEFFVFNKDRKLIYMGLLHNSPAMTQGNNKSVYLRGEPTVFYVEDAINAALKNKAIPTTETRAYGCSVEYSSPLESIQ